MPEIQNIKLTKKTYNYDTLDEEFSEFIITSPEPSELFEIYNDLFYDIPQFGEEETHEFLIKKSSEYINFDPPNPKNQELIELKEEIEELKEELDSIEGENPFFKNGSVLQARQNDQLNYHMQSGRTRQINSSTAFKLIKKRAGKPNISNSEFSIPLDLSAIRGIPVGPPINSEKDLNISILKINRFQTKIDDRSIDD